MREVVLVFPVRDKPEPAVLLGLKKRGFGKGKIVGFGGKIELGESLAAAAVRELQEEAGLLVAEHDLQPAGQIMFFFPAQPAWDHLVHVFRLAAWQGVPQESVEMQPAWFDLDAIPLASMWDDAACWLPQVLAGHRLEATFWYGEDGEKVARAVVEMR